MRKRNSKRINRHWKDNMSVSKYEEPCNNIPLLNKTYRAETT